ncbi:conserved protein of unknown function [Candidatus Nitrotoga arctica]|uniref:DUF1853 family protein n=2 Tax=Candidatus Nitrotoga arctica TaxID=453162 RepID=A0ABN8AKD5_9PROT|nr:conserved protein of unknown function [Candidatus Nitrotoga arctica]
MWKFSSAWAISPYRGRPLLLSGYTHTAVIATTTLVNMSLLPQDSFMDSLRDPTVRDLAWVIGSPGLLDETWAAYAGRVVEDEWCRAQLKTCVQWLAGLDHDPHSLHDFIAQRPTRRLGQYFESLIAFWLAHIPDTQIFATNLQVQNAQRTLGEYDFLFRDADGNTCHWETAVKFYLQAEPLSEQHAFIGLAVRDRLDIKLDRVFQHQLELGHTPAGRAALPQGVALKKTQAFIKGYLFYPVIQVGKSFIPITPIPGVSVNHLSGWWIRHPVGVLPQATPDSYWTILPRLRFLAPVRLDAGASVMQHTEIGAALDAHFAVSDESVQVIELQRNMDNSWREATRGFVMCSKWPVINT